MNQTRLNIYENLLKLGKEISRETISSLDSHTNKNSRLVKTDLLNFDYSKQRLSSEVLEYLLQIPDKINLKESLTKLFDGQIINASEGGNVPHTLYRSEFPPIYSEEIFLDREKINIFLNELGNRTSIKNIIFIGIGGSRLGPEFLCEFQSSPKLKNIYFCSSLDLLEIKSIINSCIQKETLVIVASKSFLTTEVLKNLDFVTSWLNEEPDLEMCNHLYGISANNKAMDLCGIDHSNQFKVLDSLGGRFSIWSSMSLPAFVNSNFDSYLNFLEGARIADIHTLSSPWENNIAVLMALISIWNTTGLNINNHGLFTYNFKMRSLTKYIAQLSMESNGKSVNFEGHQSVFPTSPLVWGGYGIDHQHSTFQWLLQGKTETSCDFIGINDKSKESLDNFKTLLAQVLAVTYGEENHENSYKSVKGNNPCSIFQMHSYDLTTLGFLLALYENKTFIEAHILGIDAFDQWGVQLGKNISTKSSENEDFFLRYFNQDLLS